MSCVGKCDRSGLDRVTQLSCHSSILLLSAGLIARFGPNLSPFLHNQLTDDEATGRITISKLGDQPAYITIVTEATDATSMPTISALTIHSCEEPGQ